MYAAQQQKKAAFQDKLDLLQGELKKNSMEYQRQESALTQQ